METETILHVALFSGILGFLAFCVSYAFHVWRSRNSASGRSPGAGKPDRLFQWSVLSLCLGGALLVVCLIWREVSPREGVLSGEGLYTVRATESLQLECVTSARTVCTGAQLARFRSPERRAELIELGLKRQILQSELKAAELQPLTPDSELVREYERAVADQRQFLASLTYLIPEHAVVVREKLRDRLDKTERVNALTTRIETARHELQQATARRELARKHRTRVENLSEVGAAAELERDERLATSAVEEAEVSRLQASIENMQIERRHIQEGLPVFAACTSQQAEDLQHQLANVQERLAATGKQVELSHSRLDSDRARAEQLRAQTIARLNLELQQCQARLESIDDVLVVKAPFDGQIAYADPAPGIALPHAPVVVLAPEEGFRLRLRMTVDEVEPLSLEHSVPLALVAPVLHRRFPGRLVKWERLVEEPGYAVAELVCYPPADTVRELAAHDWGSRDWLQSPAVRIRLLWRPPISASPLYVPAIGMTGVGLVGLLAMRLRRSRRGDRSAVLSGTSGGSSKPEERQPALPLDLITPANETGLPLAPAALEAGALGRNLQMLGNRFRESIKRRQVEPSLLSAVEWAIDRHHTRAIEHLALGLDHDPELASELEGLFSAAESTGSSSHANGDVLVASRVRRILVTLAPDLLTAAGESPQGHMPNRGADPHSARPSGRPGVVSR